MSSQLHANPYAAPAMDGAAWQNTARSTYPGIGRLAYFGYTFLAGFAYQMAMSSIQSASKLGAATPSAEEAGSILTLLLVYLGVMFYCVSRRMVNIGSSVWWCLGICVPFLNVFIGGQCLICPAGYAQHRTLDGAGKTILGIFTFLFVMVISAIIGIVVIGSQQ